MTPGVLIKRARENKGWTQRQLADAIGVTSGFVAKVEADESLPSYERCVALAELIGPPLNDLWRAVEGARAEAAGRRIRTRGLAMRGAVRTPEGADDRTTHAAKSPEDIAREIAENADLRTAYGYLTAAFADPTMRTTVLNTLEAFARAAAAQEQKTPRRR